MEDKKTLANYLKDVYNNSSWYIPDTALEILLRYKELGDIRAQIVLMVSEFNKSPVIVNKLGFKKAPLNKAHKEPIKFLQDTIAMLESRDDISDLLKIELDNEFFNTKKGIICCCYRALGHIYSGKWGKIPLQYKKGKECYLKVDELNGFESYETQMYQKDIVKSEYRQVLEQQLGIRSPNDYIRKSVKKSGINPHPTDPDLYAEASGKDKK